MYFYERSFQVLKPDGALSFITSNKWFRARYGQDLRQYMATHTKMRQIIDFGDEAVFDALAYPTIIIATLRDKPVAADKATNDVRVLNWDGENDDHQVIDFPEVFAREGFVVPQSALKLGGWQLEPPTERILLERLRKVGQPLGDYCDNRMYIGLKTGLNEAFVLTAEERERLVARDPHCLKLIQPFVRGKDIKRWHAKHLDRYLIRIESSENVVHPWSGLDARTAEKKFSELYPTIHEWFSINDRRQKLIHRSDQGNYFWELRSCAYWDEFGNGKITFPDIAIKPEFAWDKNKYLVDMTAFIITGVDRWVLAVLNSTVNYWFYNQISPQIQNGYFRFKAQYCKQIPIPTATINQQKILRSLVDAVALAAQGLNSMLSSAYIREYERLLNGLVYELFFPEDFHAKNVSLFDACAAAGVEEGMDAQTLASTIFKNDHAIYAMLFDLQALDVVRTIEGAA